MRAGRADASLDLVVDPSDMTILIREGDRSPQVADVQARLRGVGIEVTDELGVFGGSTTRAVKAFQQTRGVLVDGIVGPNTWAELVATQWRLGDRVLYLSSPHMRGDDVDELQRRLNSLGFDAGRQDGTFGPDTDRAVRSFQREYGLRVDGFFGVRSLTALSGLRADRPATAAALREQLRRAERPSIHGSFVVLDPGHGGEDRGESSPAGLHEDDICWHLARRVADGIIGSGGRARFTRTEVEGPDVTERARRANEMGADLFISLHVNAHDAPEAGGASTYYFPTSKGGEMLADAIQTELVEAGVADCRTHARSYQILRETRMPAVLVEPGFITNPEDETMLLDPERRQRLADAIVAAVSRYFEGGLA